MKNLFIAIMALGVSASAFADGYKCSYKNELNVYLYNNLSGATRDAAVVILSNPSFQKGNRTYGKFKVNATVVNNASQSYELNTDMRYNDQSKPGANLLGTKWAMINFLALDVNFSYDDTAKYGDGDKIPGGATIQVFKRQSIGGRTDINAVPGKKVALSCVRYVKGEHNQGSDE